MMLMKGYFSLCIESIRVRHESIQLSTEKDFKVFRVDRIDSRTPRINSYPSRDKVSLSGLQGIDSHPSGIDSGPKHFKNRGRHHRSDVYVSRSDSGGLRADDPAYDNSGLSGVVHDRGVFGLTSRCTGVIYAIRRETPNYIYEMKP
ncbi:hypothetical protein PIB30_094454 [Stylosanthes scabra]|uniref:Uncharacterized protein n=1 Tax=Stylosanthes scabra TaxID=79078 RepID=A0ABU6XV77_9FABA|nr:hypothetical protein [Stylosanthes scabra]